MKKTTKILLVLAAVVAMTIGAVSTVMAADEFPTISKWNYDSTAKTYSALDADGEEIVRGWAQDNGKWYWFDSSVMVANTFITYKEDIYYLDKNGCMAIGWIEFAGTGDAAKVNAVDKYDKTLVEYANVTQIDGFGDVFEIDTEDAMGDDLFVNLFADIKGNVNKTVWCYFDEHGVMANDEWVKAWDIWYYMYGPYVVMDDYKVAIELNASATGDAKFLTEDGEGYYGFGKDGAMLVNWVQHSQAKDAAVDGTATDKDTPYFNETAGTAATTTTWWVYYHENGRLVNTTPAELVAKEGKEGWEKINGNWTYFIEDEKTGMKLLQNTVLFDVDTDVNGLLDADGQKGTFYLDDNGFMVTGAKTFKKNTAVPAWLEETATAGTFKVVTAIDGDFYFDTTIGKMLDGVIGNYYYKDFTDATEAYVCLVESADITKTGIFTVDDSTASLTELDGQKVAKKNFFLVIKDAADIDGDKDKAEYVVMYFESGRLQRNQGITFGETTLAIDANGLVQTGAKDAEIVAAGFKYKFTDAKYLTITGSFGDIVINGVVRK